MSYSNPNQLQFFSSNGALAASNAYEFVTGSSGLSGVSMSYSVQGGSSGYNAPDLIYFANGVQQTTTLSTTTATTTSVSTTTVNSAHDSTITKLSCSPTSVAVNVKTTCTAKITDDGPAPTLPSGIASFSSTGSGTFGTVSCTSSASTKTLTCKASFAPSSIPAGGSETISATYQSDSSHDKSLGTFKLKVT